MILSVIYTTKIQQNTAATVIVTAVRTVGKVGEDASVNLSLEKLRAVEKGILGLMQDDGAGHVDEHIMEASWQLLLELLSFALQRCLCLLLLLSFRRHLATSSIRYAHIGRALPNNTAYTGMPG